VSLLLVCLNLTHTYEEIVKIFIVRVRCYRQTTIVSYHPSVFHMLEDAVVCIFLCYSANNGILPEVLLMTDKLTTLQYTYYIIVVYKSDFHYVLSYRVNGCYIRVVQRFG